MSNSANNQLSEWFSAAVAAQRKGDLRTAAGLYQQILGQKPDFVQAWLNLGLAHQALRQLETAVTCFEKGLRINSRLPGAHLALGSVLKELGKLEDAAECCRREIKLSPQNPHAFYNLGLIRQNQDRLPEAAECYQKTLKLDPKYADALVDLGGVRLQEDKPEEAIRYFEKALEFQPGLPRAHWSRARALLLQGDYARGFPEHEWRWKMQGFTTPAWNFPQPLWDGRPLQGRAVLLHAEQGAGDTLQFIRYAPLVAERGGRVIAGCPANLAELLRRVPGVAQVVTSREHLPAFDAHAPAMSLPAIFGTTLATIPAHVPYLSAPPVPRILPTERAPGIRLRLGLVWAGGISDLKRNVPLETLLPLLKVQGITFHSLQVGDHAQDLLKLPPGLVENHASLLRSFADTARLLDQLDGVITVDTGVAHLAGAMGRPVWTLLHFSADWRWLRHRDDSPWYPTMRLFRQPSPGAWGPVVARITELARQILSSARPPEFFCSSS